MHSRPGWGPGSDPCCKAAELQKKRLRALEMRRYHDIPVKCCYAESLTYAAKTWKQQCSFTLCKKQKSMLKMHERQKYANNSSWVQTLISYSLSSALLFKLLLVQPRWRGRRKKEEGEGFKRVSHYKKKESYAHSLKRCSDIIAHSQKRSSAVCIAMTTRSSMLMDIPDLLFIHPSPHYSFIHTHAHTCALKQAFKLIYHFWSRIQQSSLTICLVFFVLIFVRNFRQHIF